MTENENKIRVETYRSGIFTFQVGVDLSDIQPLLQRVEDAHARFAAVPILPDVATKLEREVVVSSVFGTNTIEGGTLTEEETAVVIDTEEAKEEEEKRVLNIRQAYSTAENFADICIKDSKASIEGTGLVVGLQEKMIKDLHAIITNGLAHPHNIPGKYRDNQKGQLTKVGDNRHGGVYTPPKCHDDIDLLIQQFLKWINSPELSQLSPLIRAPLAHYYFERIHPFWDGNGRVGRVLEAMILKCSGYKYAPFALSRYYLEQIDEYFTGFNLARKAEDDKEKYPNTAFVSFFLEGMLKVLNQLHDRVNRIIAMLLYETSLNTKLQSKKINLRQFTIINNLLPHGTEHTLQSLQSQPWYLGLYQKLTPKTRSRDLKGLAEQS
ncbi:MAG: Fic family protein, partial [Pseudomonadota bacterium]|nr:Fic family protein [Pseudomonadota bacterium]